MVNIDTTQHLTFLKITFWAVLGNACEVRGELSTPYKLKSSKQVSQNPENKAEMSVEVHGLSFKMYLFYKGFYTTRTSKINIINIMVEQEKIFSIILPGLCLLPKNTSAYKSKRTKLIMNKQTQQLSSVECLLYPRYWVQRFKNIISFDS